MKSSGKGLKKTVTQQGHKDFKALQQPKKASVLSTLFRQNTDIFSIRIQTNHTDRFNQHLKADLPRRKHIYYLMVHNNAAFQFTIGVEDYHIQGKLEREFREVQGHSLPCLR